MSTAIIVFELRFGFYNDAICFMALITKKNTPDNLTIISVFSITYNTVL